MADDERVFKAGYVLRKEQCSSDESIEIISAYTPDGHYIGSSKNAKHLCVKRGIRPQLASETHRVCSIGFSSKDGKWYGWSHRAIFGFKKGSTCKEGDAHYNGRAWTANNIIDAKQMAKDFAESVS